MKKRFQLPLIVLVILAIGYFLMQWSGSGTLIVVLGTLVEIVGVIITIRLLLWDRRVTTSKVAWIAVIFILPIFGVVFYLFFGRNPQKRIFLPNQTREMNKLTDKIHHLPSYHSEGEPPTLSKSIAHLTGIQPISGNDVQLLTNGEETFPAIIAALKEAKNHIHMQYYIYKADAIGTEIRDILIERAQAGVKVRFMYDAWGSAKLTPAFLAPLKNAGIETVAFDPISSLTFARTANLRNHRKVIIIDGQTAFTGGLNVGEEYRSNTPDFVIWRDTHLRLAGPAVMELQESFLVDWIYMQNRAGSATEFISKNGIARYFSPTAAGVDWAQVIYGGPYDKEKWVRDAILDLIDSAKESVWIASPYFVPDEEALAVVRRVAMSGIDVRIILPGKGDRGISFHGSNAYIETLIEAGVKVYAYRADSFVHSKLLLVDGKRAAVGTANFDIRSFRLNHELMVFLYNRDPAIVQMETDFQADFLESTLYTMGDMRAKSLYVRLKENLSSLLSPIL